MFADNLVAASTGAILRILPRPRVYEGALDLSDLCLVNSLEESSNQSSFESVSA